jgi:hypothetical protein
LSDKTTEIKAVLITSGASTATMECSCRNSVTPLVSPIFAQRSSCVVGIVAFLIDYPVL